jgi:hypothetical protein
MNRFRHPVGALILAVSLAVAAHEASAQDEPQPSRSDPARQAKTRKVLNDRIDGHFNDAVEAQKRGDCVTLQYHILILEELTDPKIISFLASSSGTFLPPAQRREIVLRGESRLAKLLMLDCPPKTAAQTAPTPPPPLSTPASAQGTPAMPTGSTGVDEGRIKTAENAAEDAIKRCDRAGFNAARDQIRNEAQKAYAQAAKQLAEFEKAFPGQKGSDVHKAMADDLAKWQRYFAAVLQWNFVPGPTCPRQTASRAAPRTAAQPPRDRRETVADRAAEVGRRTGVDPRDPRPLSQDAGVQFHVGASVSVQEGTKNSNGGLGGKHSVTSPNLDLSISPPGSGFQTRFFGGQGDSKENLTGRGGIMLQPNGGTQDVSGAGNVSGGKREAKITRVGGDVLFKIDSPPISPAPRFYFTFTPLVGAGFEHISQETRLDANWNPINFFVEDTRKVETNRVSFLAGSQLDIPGVNLFVRGNVQLNLDSVSADGRYHTFQVGVFDEAVTGSVRKTAFTVGGKIAVGGATTFANGVKLELNTFVGSVPMWQMEYHAGGPPTLNRENNLNYGGQFRVIIDTNAFATAP